MSDPNAGDLVKTGAAAIVASIVRTVVPMAVGLVVAWFTKLGIPVADQDVASLVNGLVSGVVALLYYLVVRVLEVFASSKFGWLLGFAKAPVYVPSSVAAASSARVVAVTQWGEPDAFRGGGA